MPLEPEGLASEIEKALSGAWVEVKKSPFPGGDPNDRRPIFLAIARGLLQYLHDHQTDMISTMDLSTGGAIPKQNTVSNLNLNITLS